MNFGRSLREKPYDSSCSMANITFLLGKMDSPYEVIQYGNVISVLITLDTLFLLREVFIVTNNVLEIYIEIANLKTD